MTQEACRREAASNPSWTMGSGCPCVRAVKQPGPGPALRCRLQRNYWALLHCYACFESWICERIRPIHRRCACRLRVLPPLGPIGLSTEDTWRWRRPIANSPTVSDGARLNTEIHGLSGLKVGIHRPPLCDWSTRGEWDRRIMKGREPGCGGLD